RWPRADAVAAAPDNDARYDRFDGRAVVARGREGKAHSRFSTGVSGKLEGDRCGQGRDGRGLHVLIAGLLLVVNRQFVGNWLWTSVTILLGLVFVVGIGL